MKAHLEASDYTVVESTTKLPSDPPFVLIQDGGFAFLDRGVKERAEVVLISGYAGALATEDTRASTLGISLARALWEYADCLPTEGLPVAEATFEQDIVFNIQVFRVIEV